MKEFELQKKFNWELASEKINSNVSSSQFKYEIGDYVESEGGIILYRFLNGITQNYLVIDTDDVSTQQVWTGGPNFSAGASSSWDGLTNSNIIVNHPSHTTSAAKLCLDSTRNGKSDWYLPAIDELYLITVNKFIINKKLEEIGGTYFKYNAVGTVPYAPFEYWSSSEYDTIYSLYVWTGGEGVQYTISKNLPLRVRAVRKFTI